MIFPQFTQLFDSHCHLNAEGFDDERDEIVSRSMTAGVLHILDIGVDIESSYAAIANAQRYANQVFAVVGIDPEVLIPGSDLYISDLLNEQDDQSRGDEAIFAMEHALSRLVNENREYIAAIGETGIDNYWLAKKVNAGELSPELQIISLQKQEYLFRQHLDLALKHGLPLSIHSRGAEQKCLEIVREFWQTKGIFHSYTGGYETAKGILDAGWGLGVNGIVTYKNSQELREMYRKLLGKVSADWSPADFYERGIYFETDGPYLSPEPKRGERNEPANVKVIFKSFIQTMNE